KPLAHEEVDRLRELEARGVAVDDLDDAVELAARDRLARRGGDLRLVERVDLARSGLARGHRQQARARAEVQHALSALDHLADRLRESVRARPVRYHEALPGELGVAFEIEIHELRCSARAPLAMAKRRLRASASIGECAQLPGQELDV